MIHYGFKLQLVRTRFKLTQTAFAEKLGIKPNAYAKVENNTIECSLQLLDQLFKGLNISPRWFFLDEGKMFRDTAPSVQTPIDITSLTPFHLIRVISTLEKVIVSYRERLQVTHGLNECQVNMIIDNYANEATGFNIASTDVKIIYNNEFTYHLTRP